MKNAEDGRQMKNAMSILRLDCLTLSFSLRQMAEKVCEDEFLISVVVTASLQPLSTQAWCLPTTSLARPSCPQRWIGMSGAESPVSVSVCGLCRCHTQQWGVLRQTVMRHMRRLQQQPGFKNQKDRSSSLSSGCNSNSTCLSEGVRRSEDPHQHHHRGP